jgi:hypothetical protein
VEQGVKGLVVLAPLPIALGEVQQVMGAALQRRQPRWVDRPSLLDDPAGIAQLHRDRGPMDADVGGPKDGPEVVAVRTQPLGDHPGLGEKLVGPSPIASPRRHHRAGLQQGTIDRQMGRYGTTESWLQGGQGRDRDLLGLVVAAHCQQRVGQRSAAGGHHQAILGLFGREDAAVGRDPGKITVPGVGHGKAHALVGLGKQPVRCSPVVAVELPRGELGVR